MENSNLAFWFTTENGKVDFKDDKVIGKTLLGGIDLVDQDQISTKTSLS